MAAAKQPAKKRAAKQPPDSSSTVGAGEFRSATAVRTALIPGNTFHSKAVQYVEIDGMAMVEGDIVLGEVGLVEQASDMLAAERRGELMAGVIRVGAQYRWPNCQVPYTIDGGLPDQARVTDAIAHWESSTQFRFIARTAANASAHPDYVTFRSSSGCSSSVGKQGGQQFVNLAGGCTKGNAIHEIGHTVGLWHEQSREDRDAFVTVHWDKIQAGLEHNFNQQISDGDDVGVYDYGSIMHYPRNAFSTDGSDTITPVDLAAAIGQRTALSAGDISAANSMCPGGGGVGTVVETIKERIPETGKEFVETAKERIPETGKEFVETVKERIPETGKEFVETVKERIPETRKEFVETVKERIPETGKEFVETVVETAVEGVGQFGGGGPVINPNPGMGGLLPFAMQTPHVGAGDAGDDATADALLSQLAAINGAIDDNADNAAVLASQRDQLVAALGQLGWQ